MDKSLPALFTHPISTTHSRDPSHIIHDLKHLPESIHHAQRLPSRQHPFHYQPPWTSIYLQPYIAYTIAVPFSRPSSLCESPIPNWSPITPFQWLATQRQRSAAHRLCTSAGSAPRRRHYTTAAAPRCRGQPACRASRAGGRASVSPTWLPSSVLRWLLSAAPPKRIVTISCRRALKQRRCHEMVCSSRQRSRIESMKIKDVV